MHPMQPLVIALASLVLLSASSPAQAALGRPQPIADGVDFYEVELPRGGTTMTVWIYVPEGIGKVPVVLIAPAGAPPVQGMELTEAHRPEHLPYARAGHVVVAYSTDGALGEDRSNERYVEAAIAFRSASAGVDNAMAALDFALQAVNRADPQRVFTAGRGSAGTLALQVAMKDERIQGVMAYAPYTDLEARLELLLSALEARIGDLRDFVRSVSPLQNADRLKRPVLLVHAVDDFDVIFEESRNLAERLAENGADVRFVPVPSGGHYRATINRGIPEGLSWIRERTGHGLTAREVLVAEAIDFPGGSARRTIGVLQPIVFRLGADPDSGGLVLLETDGELDTVVAILDDEGAVIFENDDISEESLLSRVLFHAQPGRTYFARIGSLDEEAGEVVVRRRVLARGSLAERASDWTEETVRLKAFEDAVYRFDPTSRGPVSIRTVGQEEGTDTVLVVFDSQGRIVAANDDLDEWTTDSAVEFEATPGTTYYVQVMGFGGSPAAFRLDR